MGRIELMGEGGVGDVAAVLPEMAPSHGDVEQQYGFLWVRSLFQKIADLC